MSSLEVLKDWPRLHVGMSGTNATLYKIMEAGLLVEVRQEPGIYTTLDL